MYTLKWATITFVVTMSVFTTTLFTVILGHHFIAWVPLSDIYWPGVWSALRFFTMCSLGLTAVAVFGLCSK